MYKKQNKIERAAFTPKMLLTAAIVQKKRIFEQQYISSNNLDFTFEINLSLAYERLKKIEESLRWRTVRDYTCPLVFTVVISGLKYGNTG